MALRMTPDLMRALACLHEVGTAGAGDRAVAYASVLAEHGLAERFEDPRRTPASRIRLTANGERFAVALTTEGARSMSDLA